MRVVQSPDVDEPSWSYTSDQKAMALLEDKQAARQVRRLLRMTGHVSTESTELDVASLMP